MFRRARCWAPFWPRLAFVLEFQRVDVERGYVVESHRAAVAPLLQRCSRASVAVVVVAVGFALFTKLQTDDVVRAAFVQRGLSLSVDNVERRRQGGAHIADDVWLVA